MADEDLHGTFDDILALCPMELRGIATSLRALIVSLDKTFVEVVWSRQKIASYGVGQKKMTQHYAYIAIHASHINLGFYQGVSLPDTDALLQGSGKNLRHIQIRDEQVVRSEGIKKLLNAAIAERRSYQNKSVDENTK